jgi:hypothetical protein
MSTSPALPRLRRTVELLCHLIRVVARDTALWSDDVWVVDSTAIRATSGGCGYTLSAPCTASR